MTDTRDLATFEEVPPSNLPALRAIRPGTPVAAFVPQDFEQAIRISRAIAASGMAPKSYNNDPNRILVGMMTGAEVGLTPMQSLRGIAVIGNQPSLWGDVALGLVMSTGLVDDMVETQEGNFDDLNNGDGLAVCTIRRKNRPSPVTVRFGMADARRAGLLTKAGPWKDGYRPRMCQMRARGFALRDLFADVLAGLTVAETTEDEGTLLEQTRRNAEHQRIATEHDLAAQAEGRPVVPRETEAEPTAEEQAPAAPKRRGRPPKAAEATKAPDEAESASVAGNEALAAEPKPRRAPTDADWRGRATFISMKEDFEKDAARYREEELTARAAQSETLAENMRKGLAKMEAEVDFSLGVDPATGEVGAGYEDRQNPEDEKTIYREEGGYDLNRDPMEGQNAEEAKPIGATGPVSQAAALESHLNIIQRKELVADIKAYEPVGLDSDHLLSFESARAELVQKRINEAKAGR